MSKYSNVSAKELKSTIETALNELNGYNLDSIKNSLVSSSILQSSVTNVINMTLGEIMTSSKTGSISTLKNNFNTLKTACDNIIEIQKLENEIKVLKDEIAKLEPQKTKTVTYSEVDEEGNRHDVSYTVTDWDVVNQINAKNASITIKKNTITTLEKNTDALLSN